MLPVLFSGKKEIQTIYAEQILYNGFYFVVDIPQISS